ncbi:MAG TPA: hypothetical protein VIZ18_10620, partial [Ktedonobacteraceae bacterium]
QTLMLSQIYPSTLFLCKHQSGEEYNNSSPSIEKLQKRSLPAFCERGYTELEVLFHEDFSHAQTNRRRLA